MEAASPSISDDGTSQCSMRSGHSSSNPVLLPLGVTASPTFTALGGSFSGLRSTSQSTFSRAAILHNTSLFNTSSRSMHASNIERLALLRVMSEHLPALETRDTDARTVHKRASVWGEITEKFNASTAVKRSRHQVQTLYKNMKAKAKKYQSRCLDPINSVLERDHVSEMLLEMLNDEYQQRRSVMQRAAIMTFREDSSSVDFRDPHLARDVSQFLKQEMHEASDVDSTAVLSPQASVCSPNSGTGDSSSGSCRGATSSLHEKPEATPPDDNQKLSIDSISQNVDTSSRDVKSAAELAIPKEDQLTEERLPQRPESVRMQELAYEQHLFESQNGNKKSMRNRQPDSNQFINNESIDTLLPAGKRRKIALQCQQFYDTSLEVDTEQTNTSNENKTNVSLRKKQEITRSFSPTCCCSSLHDELLKMKQLEHKLKMQILEQELDITREKRTEEKEMRKIEHEMRLKFLENQYSFKIEELKNNLQSDVEKSSDKDKLNSAQEGKTSPNS